MKHLLIFITLITAYGCSPIPQLVAPSPVSATAVSTGVTFNKIYAGSVATCGSLYTVIESLYKGNKISKAEAVELKGRVDGVRAALDEARVLHLTNSPRARAALSSVLNSLSIIREDVMTFKQRLAV